MNQFLQTFFEESFEGLDIMEKELLALDVGNADPETINTIFRAAHSIKGGSGTFGLNAVADYTHVLETLLDEMRDGRRSVTQEAVDVLLRSVDVLRDMLRSLQDGNELDHQEVVETQQALQKLLEQGGVPVDTASGTEDGSDRSAQNTGSWQVFFKPHLEMMKTGNDPVRLLRELCDLGECSVRVNLDALPPLAELDPECSYLAWDIELSGEVDKAAIAEIFEWVEDECELRISPLQRVQETSKSAGERRQVPDRRDGGDRRRSASGESASIRVSIDKVDELINTVGELVITQSMLGRFAEADEITAAHFEQLRDGLAQLERNTRELQESVMRIRMLPISFAFQRFPRLVRDLSNKLDKKIELKLSGEQTELDKTVMEKISDPLVHTVRNAIDHGIESPEQRRQAGKDETGTVHLNAYHQGGNIVIEIADDGAGLNKDKILNKAIERGLVQPEEQLTDEQAHDLIFHPGFSTADVVSDVSGRGVGMDVVRKNIRSLGGTVEVRSITGQGSTFVIRLPLTLAILDGQLIKVGDQTYIIPLVSILESIQVHPDKVNIVNGGGEVYKLRDEYIPIVRLYHLFGIEPDTTHIDRGLLVVVEADGQKIALFVDDLLAQQQVVIKSLESNYKRIEGLSGATILGDGTVALILDITGLMNLHRSNSRPLDLNVIRGGNAAA
jgi:two-component system chemotaxis sensor kinase CheA